jgi:tetratricopeptide (TPR) repeat protein
MPILVCVFLAAAVFLAFSPALRNGFTGYDDGEYVTGNPHVRTGLTSRNVAWAFTAAHSNNWHPLTWVSHALDSQLFGLAPAGHHLTSLLLHIANTLLLFLWLGGTTGRTWRSAFVALAFGLHPLHVESVAWVAERKDVLSTFFWMLTLLAYTAYARRPGTGRYLLVAALLAAGLMSKQMLVTVPVLLLVLDWWPLQRTQPVRRLVLEKLPLLLLSGLACAAALWAQRLGGAVTPIDQLPFDLRLANAALSYVRYLGKAAWPASLSVFYPFPLQGIAAWKVLASLALLATVPVLAFTVRRTRPWLAAGWCWYVLTLLPVIGLVQVGMQSMADRYTYVPIIGLFIALAWEAGERARQSVAAARLLPVAAGLLLAVWAILSWRQILVWQDGVTLFTHALVVTPDNFLAHDNLGVELDRRGRPEEALAHYREAIRIKPGDRHGEANYAQASFAKAERLLAAGQRDEALAQFREGLRYRPSNALAHSEVGRILSQQQKLPDAIAEFRLAIESDPTLAAAHMGLAVALSWTGHPKEARLSFENALRYDPKNVEAHYDLGLVLSVLGQPQEALQHFAAAIQLNPVFGPAHAASAEIFFKNGRYQDAWREVLAAYAANTDVDPTMVSQITAHLHR